MAKFPQIFGKFSENPWKILLKILKFTETCFFQKSIIKLTLYKKYKRKGSSLWQT